MGELERDSASGQDGPVTVHPDALPYFEGRAKANQAARSLDEGFAVTYAKSVGELDAWFLKPKEHLVERFGLDREVLAIFSTHRETDARVITAVDNILSDRRYVRRLDPIVALVIHSGDPEATESMLARETDRIIIPVALEELISPNRGDLYLRSLLARTVGATDLFAMSSPLTTDRYFFGRDELVRHLVERATGRRENSGVFGLRKTGKTSVLFAVRRVLGTRDALCEYIDCQSPGIHAGRWWQVLGEVVRRIAESVEQAGEAVEIRGDYQAETASASFTADIKRVLRGTGHDHVVLMLDEIEYITHGLSGRLGQHWDEDFLPFWQTIRATHQETEGRLTFIVAGVNPVAVESTHLGDQPNPIFQLAVPQYLEPLSRHHVRTMVRTLGRYGGLDVEEEVYTYLQDTYGGHPYLIRLACSEIWRHADVANPHYRPRITNQSFRRLRGEIRERLAQPIRDILLSLVWWYPDEYDVLRILAEGDPENEQFVADYLDQHPGSVMQFARYGLLGVNSAQFAIADVQQFLRDHGDEYKRQISPFMRGDMPAELLPEVPDLADLGRLFEMRTQVEVRLRQAVILYLGMRANWDPARLASSIADVLPARRDRPRPTELFVGRSPQVAINDLYTLDLKAIIIGHWDVFSPLFDGDRTRTEMNLETLNRARRVDAHSKPMRPGEIADIENSYGWLLGRLTKLPGVPDQ